MADLHMGVPDQSRLATEPGMDGQGLASPAGEAVTPPGLAPRRTGNARLQRGGDRAVEPRVHRYRLRHRGKLRLEFGDVPVEVHDTMLAPRWCHHKLRSTPCDTTWSRANPARRLSFRGSAEMRTKQLRNTVAAHRHRWKRSAR